MAPDSIGDEARTRSDEAVRRLREASRRRIERQNGWRAFSSLCALASLVGGISLAAMNARDARLQAEETAAQVVAEQLRLEAEALVVRRAAEAAERAKQEAAARAAREAERAAVRAAADAAKDRRGPKDRIIGCRFDLPRSSDSDDPLAGF